MKNGIINKQFVRLFFLFFFVFWGMTSLNSFNVYAATKDSIKAQWPTSSAQDRVESYGYSTWNITNKQYSCTWYAWCLAYDHGTVLPERMGNAVNWYGSASAKGCATGTEPRANSIACYSGGAGHVAYVVSVDGNNKMTIWQGGSGSYKYSNGQCGYYGTYMGVDQLQTGCNVGYDNYGNVLQGFIYLDNKTQEDAMTFNSISHSSETDTTAHVQSDVTVKRSCYEVGVEYSTNSDMSNAQTLCDSNNPKIRNSIWYDFGNGEYPSLKVGTQYYYRFYYMETSSDSRHYSNIDSFSTTGNTVALKIADVRVSDITYEGYSVTCTVTDDKRVNRVQFPNWTTKNEQDDLVAEWQTSTAVKGVRNGNVWSFYVSRSLHNYEIGQYVTDIYAYDDDGNVVSCRAGDNIQVPPYDFSQFSIVNEDEFVAKIKNISGQNLVTAASGENNNVYASNVDFENTNKQWRFYRQTNGSYKIVNVSKRLCLDLDGGNTVQGTNIQVHEDNGTDAQRWYLMKSGSIYIIQSAINRDCVMDLQNVASGEGINIKANYMNESGGPRFSLEIVATKPEITKQPSDIKGTEGSTGRATVIAAGTGLTYQWYYQTNGTDSWKTSAASGNKTATLALTINNSSANSKYKCMIKNSAGESIDTRIVSVTDTDALSITMQPSDVSGTEGGTGRATVTAAGTGLTYQWYYQTNGTDSWKISGAAGNRTSTLSLTINNSSANSKYKCVVKNGSGKSIESKSICVNSIIKFSSKAAVSVQAVSTTPLWDGSIATWNHDDLEFCEVTLYNNGKIVAKGSTDKNKYDFSEQLVNITDADSYVFEVTYHSIDGEEQELKSATYVVKKDETEGDLEEGSLIQLAAPESLEWNTNGAKWNQVENAKSYKIILMKDGLIVESKVVSSENVEFDTNIKEVGQYKIIVVTLGDGITYNDSKESSIEKEIKDISEVSDTTSDIYRTGDKSEVECSDESSKEADSENGESHK